MASLRTKSDSRAIYASELLRATGNGVVYPTKLATSEQGGGLQKLGHTLEAW